MPALIVGGSKFIPSQPLVGEEKQIPNIQGPDVEKSPNRAQGQTKSVGLDPGTGQGYSVGTLPMQRITDYRQKAGKMNQTAGPNISGKVASSIEGVQLPGIARSERGDSLENNNDVRIGGY
ncbi:hypothetical protein BDBG_07221 [Blastomyces gilchristii SLH14081]|uniref:Uncharacterized protein n=1 Tax=Blastomyces gilchristii (strain SLH14081) TaxID=559298 RepID=A0A179UUJ1_BLAGS|nr:uncharacterized protein BDBG_07221 [Blastomyces gilchristii SLH14081]OAT11796.1 hypothetical protein BDBG_07221 [Blastomyces gilchristii SLH14081]